MHKIGDDYMSKEKTNKQGFLNFVKIKKPETKELQTKEIKDMINKNLRALKYLEDK